MTVKRGDIVLTRFPHALSDPMKAQLDACLKIAMQIP